MKGVRAKLEEVGNRSLTWGPEFMFHCNQVPSSYEWSGEGQQGRSCVPEDRSRTFAERPFAASVGHNH